MKLVSFTTNYIVITSFDDYIMGSVIKDHLKFTAYFDRFTDSIKIPDTVRISDFICGEYPALTDTNVYGNNN